MFGNSEVRIGATARSVAWLVWLAAAVWLTGPGFLWEVEYFRSPGPRFFPLLIVLLAFSPASLWGYQRLRRRGLWQWEFAVIAAFPVAAAFRYEARAATVTLVIVAACFSVGRRLRGWLRIPAEGAIEEITISSGVGLGVLHCLLFVMGLAGWYTLPAFLACILLFLLIGGWEISGLWGALTRLDHTWRAVTELRGWGGTLVTAFAAAFVACSVMVILAPSLAFDVLRVHLPLVHYYAAEHALRTPAYLPYGYLPQGIETLMTLGYVLAGDPAAQMLPPVYFVLAVLMAYRIGRICGLNRFAALVGMMFVAATPLVDWTGSVAKNDVGLAFFILAALHGYLRWRESGEFHSVLGGTIFLAMAADLKDSVVYALPPLALLYTHATMQQRKPMRAMLKLAAVFLLLGTFWHVRAWLVMGNPIYPFSAQAAVTTHGTGPGWRNLLVHCLRIPWDIHFHGRGYFESPLDNPMGVALVLFAAVWVLAGRQVNRAETACLLFCALYVAYWAVVQGQPRFAIAPILILQVLTAGRVMLFCRMMRSALRFTLYGASAYALLFGLLGATILEVNAPQLRCFAGRIDKTEYLRESLGPYRAVEFVRKAARKEDGVLSVEGCPFLYASNPGAFDCVWRDDLARSNLDVLLHRRSYRFLILPVSRAGEAPSGWKVVYADNSYQVFIAGLGR